MSREAMKIALEALEILTDGYDETAVGVEIEAITALRQALETEPFEFWNAVEGWVKIDEVREHFDSVGCGTIYKSAGEGRLPLYTAPPKAAEWVGLTDEEIAELHYEIKVRLVGTYKTEDIYRAIEAKLKERNG